MSRILIPPSEETLKEAALAWTYPKTSHVRMVPELCEVFASMLEQYKQRISALEAQNVINVDPQRS